MEESVLDRFRNAVSFLLDNKIASKQKEIAVSCNVTPNYLSGVLNNRISLSGDLVQRFLSKWPIINPSYLACQSDEIDMTKTKILKKEVGITHDKNTNVTVLRLINRLKSDTISKSDRLLAGDQLNELFAKLMDENINLRSDLLESYKIIKNT